MSEITKRSTPERVRWLGEQLTDIGDRPIREIVTLVSGCALSLLMLADELEEASEQKPVPHYYVKEHGAIGWLGVFRTSDDEEFGAFPTQEAAQAYAAWLNMIEENKS